MTPKIEDFKDSSDIQTGILEEGDDIKFDTIPKELLKPGTREREIIWLNVFMLSSLQIIAFYGVYAAFTSALWATWIWGFILYHSGCVGQTVGAHRLGSHKSFKAKWPLKVILILLSWLAHEKSIIEWARDHRMHHKYQDTDADPNNPIRGLFFAHVGWMLVKKHPDVALKGKRLDISDLYADPIISFQHKYYYQLMPLFTFILPTVLPMFFWNETFVNAFTINILRYVVTLHSTWFVNSISHGSWGMKPFDRFTGAVESNFTSIWTIGEGYHNYHHAFPWDYRISESDKINLGMYLIEFFAKIGWAYDLRIASDDLVKKRVQRTGDGSHKLYGSQGTKTN